MDIEQLEELVPNISYLDKFLEELLPQKNVKAFDFFEDILKGNWVLEPKLFYEYIVSQASGYVGEIKSLFISILVLFILSSVITLFLDIF